MNTIKPTYVTIPFKNKIHDFHAWGIAFQI
mgnify:FL=1